jgi:PAS domain S-box-containing protein
MPHGRRRLAIPSRIGDHRRALAREPRMFASSTLLIAALVYLGLLFAIAWWGDRRGVYPVATRWRPLVYSLALAVYCSSWTFYGAVGSAARELWSFLPIYLGPVLLLLLLPGVLRRLIAVGHARGLTSIADFVGSRFGKSTTLAALITLIALVAAVPYVGLQLRAVSMSIGVLSGEPAGIDGGFWVALILALFAILFGTRNVDAREHHHGLMLAVAVESLVKLLAFVAIALFAFGRLPPAASLPPAATGALPPGFAAATLLSMLAMFCLPRQFQVAVVECADPADYERGRRWFSLYLVVISLCVLPIVLAGQQLLGDSAVHPDTWVLHLPMREDARGLALLAYLGGFSAATGMVIVASVALATMVSNHLVVPLLLRRNALRDGTSLTAWVLWTRRATILALALASYAYHRATEGDQSLAAIGLTAFAAVAQFAPAMLAGLYWRGASRRGAIAGLLAGTLLWAYTLLLPAILPGSWLAQGPFGIDALRPQALFGSSGWDAITHGTFWSLLANVAALVLFSLRERQGLEERLRVASFLGDLPERGSAELPGSMALADVRALAERILGPRASQRALADYFAERRPPADHELAERGLLQHVERQLAGAIGAASARRVLTTALRGRGLELDEVMALLDETSQQLRFNRELLAATLDNISQGISVVDAEMRLVAWNRRYLELFDYPEGLVYVGRPVADLIRYNAERGECGPGDVDDHVRRRIEHMRRGHVHVFERVRADGSVIEMRGQPMPGGGFATTFTDITDYKRSERALIEAKATLEHRVEERTAALSAALAAQQQSKAEAEAANRSKSRFLAGVSHDLAQPLNAARLFASSLLLDSADPAEARRLAERIDHSLRSAEELLSGLLEVARLDSGALRPEFAALDAAELCRTLHEQFAATAAARGLALRWRCPPLALDSDRVLLRRVLQNFLANALRYTQHGGVLLSGRRRGNALLLQVWDTGPGIADEQRQRVFEEFQRLDARSPWGEQGLGLGLAICERIARLLGHPLQLASTPGRGSVFGVRVPLSAVPARPAPVLPAPPPSLSSGLSILCIDDAEDNLAALRSLLERWGHRVAIAGDPEQALLALGEQVPDLLLVDLQLGAALDGFALIAILRREAPRPLPAALVTAERGEAVLQRAHELGYPVLNKPVAPAALRALVDAVAARRGRGGD